MYTYIKYCGSSHVPNIIIVLLHHVLIDFLYLDLRKSHAHKNSLLMQVKICNTENTIDLDSIHRNSMALSLSSNCHFMWYTI